MQRDALLNWLNEQLQPSLIKDYCPNGLQVEGCDSITKVVTGVTACQALIDAAIEAGAQALLVHHGYFWKGESQPITGMKYQRIRSLIENDINLIAYHLPLDVHPEFGNNASLGRLLGFEQISAFPGLAPEGIVMQGELTEALPATEFKNRVSTVLQREPMLIAQPDATIKRAAWCTGGGQSYIESVAEGDIDLFITGEVSEQTVHIAREKGISFIAAGHHATERYGAKHLGEKLAHETGLTVEFIDIDNPA